MKRVSFYLLRFFFPFTSFKIVRILTLTHMVSSFDLALIILDHRDIMTPYKCLEQLERICRKFDYACVMRQSFCVVSD